MFRKRKEDNVEIRQTKRKVKTELRCRCKTKAHAEKEMRKKNRGEKSQPQQSATRETRTHPFNSIQKPASHSRQIQPYISS